MLICVKVDLIFLKNMEEQNQNQTQQSPNGQKTDVMALISYLGPLCLIPFLTQEKRDEFVKFHMKQGLVLFIVEVIVSFILLILPFLGFLDWIFNIIWLVLIILGIVNVVNNEKKELPLIGQFAEKLSI